MLENAIYSVISPEGCATILWRDPKKMLDAAQAMKLSAKDLLELGLMDEVVKEPVGGAHRDKDLTLKNVKESIEKNLSYFKEMSRNEIFNDRKNKFLKVGRGKGFMTSVSSLSSLRAEKNTFYQFLDSKKKILGLLFLLSVILLSFYFLS